MARAKLKYIQNENYSYADEFDKLMEAHFGEKFKTEWNLFLGSVGGYETVRANGKKLTKQQVKVGRTISDAIAAGEGRYYRA